VSEVKRLTERFRIITLKGDALKGPMQLTRELVVVRRNGHLCYLGSPLSWDTVSGTIQFLDYRRCSPEGHVSSKLIQSGDILEVACHGSQLELGMRGTSRFVLGSETSLGIAYALLTIGNASPFRVRLAFEVDSKEECAQVIKILSLPKATLIERRTEGRHFHEVEATVASYAATHGNADYVLHGGRSDINCIRRLLKNFRVAPSRIQTLMY
jgi:hypothetical protein